jgi:hypothetical protein
MCSFMPLTGLQCVESALAAQEEITGPRTGEIDAATVLLHLLIAQRTHQLASACPRGPSRPSGQP